MRILPAHSDPVTAVSFNRDGTLITSCSMDGLMCVIKKFRNYSFIYKNTAVSGMQPPDSVLKQLLMTTTQSGTSFSSHCVGSIVTQGYSGHVRFSPNSKFLLSSTQDSTIRLWDFRSSRCLKTFTGHTNRTYCIAASFCVQNGQYIVSGSEDQKIYIWDLQSRKIAQVLECHKGKLDSESWFDGTDMYA